MLGASCGRGSSTYTEHYEGVWPVVHEVEASARVLHLSVNLLFQHFRAVGMAETSKETASLYSHFLVLLIIGTGRYFIDAGPK